MPAAEKPRLDPGATSARRRAREIALQILYQLDVQEQLSDADALNLFWKNFAQASPGSDGDEVVVSDEGARQFAGQLVRGVQQHRAAIDELITQASRNWRLERMARVDRNLLRLAVYELKHGGEVPAKVAINEAIEIAKRFGTGDSSAFVNGILDRCLDQTK